jgi:hypothetical protein
MTPALAWIGCETVSLWSGPATIWELATILREDGAAYAEYAWHIRPDLTRADAGALKVGGEAHTALGDARAVRDAWDVVTGGQR